MVHTCKNYTVNILTEIFTVRASCSGHHDHTEGIVVDDHLPGAPLRPVQFSCLWGRSIKYTLVLRLKNILVYAYHEIVYFDHVCDMRYFSAHFTAKCEKLLKFENCDF